MSNKNLDTAKKFLKLVGRDNIISATHCATRLCIVVKDPFNY